MREASRDAVLAALRAGRRHPRPIAMKRKILERFNWERTVDITERLYRKVLDQPNKDRQYESCSN